MGTGEADACHLRPAVGRAHSEAQPGGIRGDDASVHRATPVPDELRHEQDRVNELVVEVLDDRRDRRGGPTSWE